MPAESQPVTQEQGKLPGLGNWWRNRALKRERSRVDPELWPKLHAALPLLEGLSAREVQSLDDLALLFARDKNFELPQMLHSEYSAVYAQLRAFFRQDPLSRLPHLSAALPLYRRSAP